VRRTVIVIVASLFVVTGVAAVGVPAGGQNGFDGAHAGPHSGGFSDRSLGVDLLERAGSSVTATNDANERDVTTGLSRTGGEETIDLLRVNAEKSHHGISGRV
jgi:hypothetical protein